MSASDKEPQRLAFSLDEVGDMVGLGRTSLYEEIKAGRLRVLKCGRRTIVPADAIRDWLGALARGEAA